MWVARDKDGTLHLFCRGVNPKRANETVILKGKWFDGIDLPIEIDKTLFPNLKWDDEPIEVDIVSKAFVDDWRRQHAVELELSRIYNNMEDIPSSIQEVINDNFDEMI